MLAEAAARACAETDAATAGVVSSVPAEQGLNAMLRTYLSPEHLAQVELGCPLAALGSETARQAPEVRRVTTRHVKEMIDLVARQSPDWGQPAAHERALVTVAAMVGTLMLARAVDEPALSASLCEAALKHMPPR
jgi:hypothetical protein